MATDRKATTIWQGPLLDGGTGEVTLDSSGLGGTLPVSWPSRTEEPGGRTSPEELVAAAHSACFSMALSNMLAKAGHDPQRLEVSATVTFSTDGGAHVDAIALRVRGTVPGISAEEFAEHAAAAKDGCPISKLVAGNVDLSIDASLA
jgi:osmotically inducible protein OsmC